MIPSGSFVIRKKSDGVYLQIINPPRNEITLRSELTQMQLTIDDQLLAAILSAHPMDEILISTQSDINEKTDNIVLDVSADKMIARLMVKAKPGLTISVADLEAELDEKGITYGLDRTMLLEACNHPGWSFTVARGTSPVNGQAGQIIMNYHEPEMKPVLCEDGRVDYYELGQIVPVKAGDILGIHVPPTMGEAGCNVLGEVLPARPGKEAAFAIGKGVIVMDDKAIAEFDGALSWVNKKLLVVKVLTIKGDVDFSTGNIDFPGKVLITGNVPEGFKVVADDDIDVRGGVDDAVIISRRGSVFVQKGIIGRGKAVIQAYKNVEARFIQEAQVEAGQNIVVSEYVIRCDMKAGNSVLIQGRKGKIMGNNTISAKTRIKASQIQNSGGLHLVVEGIQRNNYYERIKELNVRIDNKEKAIRILTAKIRKLKDQTDDPSSLANLQKLLPEYMESCSELEEIITERALLVSILKNTRGEGMIEIGDGLEEGMRLSIKNESIDVTDKMKQLSMYYDPDEKRIKLTKSTKNGE